MSGLRPEDRAQLRSHGITPDDAAEQLRRLSQGYAPVELLRPATLGDGILTLAPEDEHVLLAAHAEAASAGRLMKFVPASGAASRMFQSLVDARQADYAEDLDSLRAAKAAGIEAAADCLRFCEEWKRLAFADRLAAELGDRPQRPRQLLAALLDADRLAFDALPKGLIPFHRIDGGTRTAFEEHLVEAGLYALDAKGVARLHFTVPPAYEGEIDRHLREGIAALGAAARNFEFGLSVQHGSTDTLAGTADGSPLRDSDGRLVLRPGGHGALLENLDDLGADLVFIKNIDNVATAERATSHRAQKALLCGALVVLQREIHQQLRSWDERRPTGSELDGLEDFCARRLGLCFSTRPDDAARRERLRHTLDRPIRVCGMVPNSGEPGGGPYWVRGADGSQSLQIVESSQIDRTHAEQRAAMESATHFNPVDLVCALRDHRGGNFELRRFVDAETGFVSRKSMDGVELRALERPGLWNGSMANWNAVFVEMPVATFTPVKTVLDLLRPEHQPA